MSLQKISRVAIVALCLVPRATAQQRTDQQEVVAGPWRNDFALQPVAKRPALEVRYVDGNRSAFEVIAARYQLIGSLRKPHLLKDSRSGDVWLKLSLANDEGKAFSPEFSDTPSRINLYRRGPYFCEVHWLDITFADSRGNLAPLQGDLALYAYPDKLLASLALHPTADFSMRRLRIAGVVDRSFATERLGRGEARSFAFPLFGEEPALAPAALETFDGEAPLEYDRVRGCYTIGTHNPGGFQDHFFRHPNHYETARFRVTNDATPRTIYVCHQTVGGAAGTVEGGVLLDGEGHPLPVTVQISKNFAGEKEEKLYNPTDRAFSETWFPVVLAAGERSTVTSLHLYQNWGRHMVKQFSSLGAWMDYFHSSTGVTETTCYVPFKFAGLRGVAIADFRAMSQASFWGGQPQHDNVAGHSFLSYHDGDEWRYLTYRGTTYHSTGPNWMDIGLQYLSTDGKIRASVRTFELPQKDELRNFIHVRYEVLAPLEIESARENFRLLTVASWVQKLRYSHFAASGHEAMRLTFDARQFAVRGKPLPDPPAFLALYGERKGSNAIVLREWSAPMKPAASVLCERSGDTRLLLVPDRDHLLLDAGDVIEFDAMWLPYGEVGGTETPERETAFYGTSSPRLVRVDKGRRVRDFPTTLRAERNEAEFVLRGGRDLIPVIVTGLSDYRWPGIDRREGDRWRRVGHDRAARTDGVQVFSEGDGRFGVVFLVAADDRPQRFRVSVGREPVSVARLRVEPEDGAETLKAPAAVIHAAELKVPLRWTIRRVVRGASAIVDAKAGLWLRSEGGSLWRESRQAAWTVGARFTPNDDDVDLELWYGSRERTPAELRVQLGMSYGGTAFEDPELKRTWLHDDHGWTRASDRLVGRRPPVAPGGAEADALHTTTTDRLEADLVAVVSTDGRRVLSMVWPVRSGARHRLAGGEIITEARWGECPPRRRLHARGKLYLIEGTLDDLYRRVRCEMTESTRRF